MSFLNVDLEAQRDPVQQPPSTLTKTSLIITKASNLLSDFANGITGFERLVNQIGTKRDGVQLRQLIENIKIRELDQYKEQLDHLINDISHLITSNTNNTPYNSVNSNLKNISDADKFSEEKLRMEFESINKHYNIIKRTYNERKSSVVLNERINNQKQSFPNDDDSSQSNETTPLFSSQQQQQQQQYSLLQQDIDIHTLLAEERSSEIKKIHGGVEEINSIYKELGNLIQQQGSQVDTIENNLSSLAQHTRNASSELVKADNYQKKKGKWTCILLMVLVIVTLIIVLAVFA